VLQRERHAGFERVAHLGDERRNVAQTGGLRAAHHAVRGLGDVLGADADVAVPASEPPSRRGHQIVDPTQHLMQHQSGTDAGRREEHHAHRALRAIVEALV
jgi:hypothetical protein